LLPLFKCARLGLLPLVTRPDRRTTVPRCTMWCGPSPRQAAPGDTRPCSSVIRARDLAMFSKRFVWPWAPGRRDRRVPRRSRTWPLGLRRRRVRIRAAAAQSLAVGRAVGWRICRVVWIGCARAWVSSPPGHPRRRCADGRLYRREIWTDFRQVRHCWQNPSEILAISAVEMAFFLKAPNFCRAPRR
jgi:hypothetical protein